MLLLLLLGLGMVQRHRAASLVYKHQRPNEPLHVDRWKPESRAADAVVVIAAVVAAAAGAADPAVAVVAVAVVLVAVAKAAATDQTNGGAVVG